MRVLVVEDNLDLQANIERFLGKDFQLDFAATGPQGLTLSLGQEYDVIVLDLMLPGMSGIELCQRYRQLAPRLVPILMLTARDTLEDKEEGFRAGADDYLVKPFSLRELRLRLEALARRPVPPSGRRLTVGPLTLEPDTGQARRGVRAVHLNKTETLLLRLLMEAAPKPVSTATLAHHLWGDDAPESSALRTHVYALRGALAELGMSDCITTLRNKGYCLDARED
ncbi:response regulator transcription factor [Myxococcus xanthus]|uniref:Transcriptional regulator n=1 Tax=Myxococcus xanthus TaxID=34 RepID=A0AAE6KR90_MYXXA|nr:response regulator transcription factor [Myxococcus xanthus]QDE67028.1 transcriptional regulator [Myxococcus xanthus]QDE74301.1 transcriptional regulator [Myxococcus xanthus]QDE81566.1 transcriptional regulator [Myxococcus xanthus]QDE95895.1 transcriptional regulator [Myxococcus xanthus]QDF03217.1 transcriptional regulator [Myxococcus xanthus]